jgi:peptidoglycan/xylan/chitin deacetylase (PgdA/CDA1 family)
MLIRKRGTMVLSLDFEMSWGRFDKMPLDQLNAESLEERPHIRRLLALMDQYEIPATWATVGHLMLDRCRRNHQGVAHADHTPHAAYSWLSHEWYRHDPCTDAARAPAWYAPDVVEWIQHARVRHEIGSHSFGHIYYGDPECTPEMAEADLKAALETAREKGITLNSFVFPRNMVGHLNILHKLGIKAYRGRDPLMRGWGFGPLLRAVHYWHQLLGIPPVPVRAEETYPGMWNIPGNQFFMPKVGIRRLIPMACQVRRVKAGINQAVRRGDLYHLWFHPFNLNAKPDAMFSGLERIFAYAARMRDKGLLDILTMGDYAQRLEESKHQPVLRPEESQYQFVLQR